MLKDDEILKNAEKVLMKFYTKSTLSFLLGGCIAGLLVSVLTFILGKNEQLLAQFFIFFSMLLMSLFISMLFTPILFQIKHYEEYLIISNNKNHIN